MTAVPAPPAAVRPRRIGLFDSGVGGLSVLRALQRQAPQVALRYVADSGHAPYGERSDEHVQQRSLQIADFLVGQGIAALVVACNTATASAIALLRQRHPALPVVGVEPGLKPAAAASPRGRIGVLATGGTLRSARFARLLAAHRGQSEWHLQACPGLAQAIEQGDPDGDAVRRLVARHCAPLRDAGVDTVVLGCTHYIFVAHHIQAELGPGVRLIDTADAVARQALGQALGPVHGAAPGDAPAGKVPDDPADPSDPTLVQLWTSGAPAALADFAGRVLGRARLSVQALPAAPPRDPAPG